MLCRVFRGAEGGGIWLSDKFAEANGIALGDTLRLRYHGAEISGEVVGLIKSGEHMICLADANQVMPDYRSFGFAYFSPQKLVSALGFAFYPQIHIRSALSKEELEEARNALIPDIPCFSIFTSLFSLFLPPCFDQAAEERRAACALRSSAL